MKIRIAPFARVSSRSSFSRRSGRSPGWSGRRSPATSAPTRSAISPTKPASGRCASSASRSRSRRCASSPAGTRAIRFRRMTGLFAFFYGTLHFLTYVIADRFAGLDFPDGDRSPWSTVAQPGGVGRRGHLQAAVHHRRLHRVDDDAAAGDHVDGRHDSPARRHAAGTGCIVSSISPAMLGVAALLVAREGRCQPSAHLRRRRRHRSSARGSSGRARRAAARGAGCGAQRACATERADRERSRHRRDGARAVGGGQDPARASSFASAAGGAACRAARRHARRRLRGGCADGVEA